MVGHLTNLIIAQFWWGSTPQNRKMSWVSWKKMTTSKRNGGLGFRDLHQFNQALLANQAWKIIQRPASMVYQILNARYFMEGNLWTANAGSQPLYRWNSLRFGAELLKQGMQISIGNGRDTTIGEKPWLPTSPTRAPRLLPSANPKCKVQDLIDMSTRQWDEVKLHQMIDPTDHHIIHKIYLPDQSIMDSILWSHTRDGRYSVKSGYWIASTTNWETSNHVFFTCMHAKAVWRALCIPYTHLCDPVISIEDKIRFCLRISKDTTLEKHTRYLPFWIMWRLWKSKNNMVFNRMADTSNAPDLQEHRVILL